MLPPRTTGLPVVDHTYQVRCPHHERVVMWSEPRRICSHCGGTMRTLGGYITIGGARYDIRRAIGGDLSCVLIADDGAVHVLAISGDMVEVSEPVEYHAGPWPGSLATPGLLLAGDLSWWLGAGPVSICLGCGSVRPDRMPTELVECYACGGPMVAAGEVSEVEHPSIARLIVREQRRRIVRQRRDWDRADEPQHDERVRRAAAVVGRALPPVAAQMVAGAGVVW